MDPWESTMTDPAPAERGELHAVAVMCSHTLFPTPSLNVLFMRHPRVTQRSEADELYAAAMRRAKQLYPPHVGWTGHRVLVREIA